MNIMQKINPVEANGTGNNYLRWLGILTTAKKAGVEFAEAQAWCEAGGGSLSEAKWDNLPEGNETPAEAQKILAGMAKKNGYTGNYKPSLPAVNWLSSAEEQTTEAMAEACRRLFTLLYNDDDVIHICNGRQNKEGKTIPDSQSIVGVKVSDFTSDVLKGFLQFDRGMYIQYNEVDDEALASSQKIKPSASIKKEMIKNYKYYYIEADPADGEDAKTFFNASAKKLETLDIPWVAHVYSGNKSIHTIIRVDASTPEEFSQRIKKIHEYCIANNYKVDIAVKDLSRWGRFPCCKRGKNYQRVMAINDNPFSYQDWEERNFEASPIEDKFYSENKKISSLKLKKYAEEMGFRCWFDGNEMLNVLICGKFVKKVDKKSIIQAITSSILTTYGEEAESVYSAVTKLPDGFFASLDEIKIENHTDDISTVYLYYKNCFLEVKKDKIITHNYDDLKGYLWGDAVPSMSREYKETAPDEAFEWNDFLKKCFSTQKQKSIKQTIGYLLSRYKNIAYPKAIILADAQAESGEEAISSGGTGKNLFLQAIMNYRACGSIDCKKMSNESRFLYSAYSRGQSIYAMNDIKHNFTLDLLYNEISGDMEVEYKGKNKMIVPFDHSPKFVLTSNFIPKGNCSGSTMRRFIIQEVENYFSHAHTPLQEYGRRFFVDWQGADWARFDAFNIACIQEFLISGTIEEVESENLKMKKIKADLGAYLFDFFEKFVDENKNDLDGLTKIKINDIYDFYKEYAEAEKIPLQYRTIKYNFKDKVKLYFRGGVKDVTDYKNKKPVAYTIKLSDCQLYSGVEEEAPF